MQAKLEAHELSYLLQTHGAQRVPGLETERFFPQDETRRQALLAEGFAALVEHGWLVPEGNGYRTNTSMMILSAVISAPERLLMVTRVATEGVEILTYSWAQQLIVEQFETEDRHFLLTRLEDSDAVLERLYAAFEIAETHSMSQPIALNQDAVSVAFGGSSAEKESFWQNHLPNTPQQVAKNLAHCHRRGLLNLISQVDPQSPQQTDLAILQDLGGEQWILTEEENQVVLFPLTQAQLKRLLG